MANALDVAAYILEQAAPMTAMKLQKLVYYSQAWHLVWESTPLFSDRIEAWANGPVAPSLYSMHRGKFQLEEGAVGGDSAALKPDEIESVDAVIRYYADKTAYQLSDLTHSERPWSDARSGYEPGAWCSAEISQSAMVEYYEGLVSA